MKIKIQDINFKIERTGKNNFVISMPDIEDYKPSSFVLYEKGTAEFNLPHLEVNITNNKDKLEEIKKLLCN